MRRIEAASDFSKRFNGAADAVAYGGDHLEDSTAAENAQHLVGEVTPLLGPLSLLFGTGSETDRAARAAFEELRRGSEELKAGGDRGRVKDALERSTSYRAGFEAAVRKIVG